MLKFLCREKKVSPFAFERRGENRNGIRDRAMVRRRLDRPTGSTDSVSRPALIRLIITNQRADRFLVSVEDARVDCLCLDLRRPASCAGSFGDIVELAVRQEFGIHISYIGLLAFQTFKTSYELVVLATLVSPLADDQPSGRFQMLPSRELLTAGLHGRLLRHLTTAREVCVAERDSSGQELAERQAADLARAIRRAGDRSIGFLDQHIAIENGQRGWTQYFDSRAIGLLSTAQGLLAHVHAGQRDASVVEQAASTIERLQNPDGGWQVRRALVGHESQLSITESTCYCLWALLEAGRRLEDPVVSQGLAWLERAQRAEGGWSPVLGQGDAQVSTTAAAVRVLARCERLEAAARGCRWLRAAQLRDGGWGPRTSSTSSSPAHTAHVLLALLATGTIATEAPVQRGCDYLIASFDPEHEEPWPSVSVNTLVDDRIAARLEFRHFATPWALAALVAAGKDLSDGTVLFGTLRLLRLQDATGVWRCQLTAPETFALWAMHDALFALGAILQASSAVYGPLLRSRYRERERQLLGTALGQFLSMPPLARTRRWIQFAWLGILTGVVALEGAAQLGLLGGFASDSGIRRAIAAVTAAVITIIPAVVSGVLIEEYRLRRGGHGAKRNRPTNSP